MRISFILLLTAMLLSCPSEQDNYVGVWYYAADPSITMEIFHDMSVSFPPLYDRTIVITDTETGENRIIVNAGKGFGLRDEKINLNGRIEVGKKELIVEIDEHHQYYYRIVFIDKYELFLEDTYKDIYSFFH